MDQNIDRREFIQSASLATLGATVSFPTFSIGKTADDSKPALLGGSKAHPGPFAAWPIADNTEKSAILQTLDSKNWGRLGGNSVVDKFEQEYSKLFGAKHALGVSSGTSALQTMLGALDIGPGDEVIIPVYTFIATYNVVTLNYALPILVDTDPESFQIDPSKITPAITKQTKLIMPVHIGGSPADLDTIIPMAEKAGIPVIEDACQAHLAEWKGKKVGNLGLGGAFSFQATKNLNSGEGGAIITNNEKFAQTCYDFHNQGQGEKSTGFLPGSSGTRGTNLRLTEFQGNLLRAQMSRVVEQTETRWKNAAYLSSLLNEIKGITPAKLYKGVTKSAFHLYMFRYNKEGFAGLSREKFLNALGAEGVPCAVGYGQMNKNSYVTGLASNRHYLKVYGEKTMKDWLERNQCPQNDYLTNNESVWFFQNMLLGTRKDMEQIAYAIKRIQKYAPQLAKA
ncbi:DegT/DnrJ/EryC1/StrS family aminotransferase [Dyadobacter aurulentus]|uniref:DegT/DnrJ/EryC1/StrS family aminotransferase n=1 Tax=Dyadobacter sp. UC 10 TaxID=2605428 RepID=UPI0011F35544|nr:DegT/DnrJ/EryC1/StrS family aminotransferase [Dyadobacter sp. UC 10]KAA0992318.1 DegT/DnrJ/EryC1/StrS family aminotransferase [Dyadobacter sp. UC 10]